MHFRVFAASVAATTLALTFANSGGVKEAHAEPTAWLAVGGGYSFQRNGADGTTGRVGAFTLSAGAGTTSTRPLVVGILWRTVTHFSLGTDIGLATRIATGGFARGDWGLALDLGVAARLWAQQNYGHYPLQAVLTGGLPWGLNLAVGADLWDISNDTPKARGGFALLEVDFLRFTVMRNGDTTRYWPNPSAADARPAATTP